MATETTIASVREPRAIVKLPLIGHARVMIAMLLLAMLASVSTPRDSEVKTLKDAPQPHSTDFAVAQAPSVFELETAPPQIEVASDGVIRLTGYWTADHSQAVEAARATLEAKLPHQGILTLNLAGLVRLDTLGALVLVRLQQKGPPGGVVFVEASDNAKILMAEVASHDADAPHEKSAGPAVILALAGIGESVVGSGKDVVAGLSYLGAIVLALGRLLLQPWRIRLTPIIFQLDQVALRGVPIIVLISFLVGCIISQQGIFQLQRFGATPFVVDLIGILVLRELGVLLTSIMVAGRSGSAFTAEIGSMKMREEIDALRVMGLDPVEVLVIPRVLALMIGLPLLTFIADMAALLGGGVVAMIYGGISTDVFLSRLQGAIGMNTFLVGLIKAPFMALVIGIIASLEGMAVKGSAESLGRQVTTSVVKAIFMVIVVDGLFAMFFAAIKY